MANATMCHSETMKETQCIRQTKNQMDRITPHSQANTKHQLLSAKFIKTIAYLEEYGALRALRELAADSNVYKQWQ